MFFRTSSPWKLKTFNRTSGLQDSLALGSSELTLIPVDFFLAMFFLAMIFRTSNPWKLETFTQNFWSSDFFGAWFFRIFKSGDVQQNFCLQILQALDQKLNLQRLGLFIRTSSPESSDASLAIPQNMLTLMIF